MMIFKFRMLSDEVDNFARVYEVSYDMDLEQFHGFICDDLGYDKSEFASFFASDEKWSKLQEYTLVDMFDDEDGPISMQMKDTLLGHLIHQKHDRLIFMFDILAARSLFIELEEAKTIEEGVEYPRVVLSEGVAPKQVSDVDPMDEGSIFDDIMEDFSDFDGAEDDYGYDDF